MFDSFYFVEKESIKKVYNNLISGSIMAIILLLFVARVPQVFLQIISLIFNICLILICIYNLQIKFNERTTFILGGCLGICIFILFEIYLIGYVELSEVRSITSNIKLINQCILILYNLMLYSILNVKSKGIKKVAYFNLLPYITVVVLSFIKHDINLEIIFVILYVINLVILISNLIMTPGQSFNENGQVNYIKRLVYGWMLVSILYAFTIVLKGDLYFYFTTIVQWFIQTYTFVCVANRVIHSTNNELYISIENSKENISNLNTHWQKKNREIEGYKSIIEKNQNFYEKVLEKIPVPIILSNKSDGILTYCNNSALEFFKGNTNPIGNKLDVILQINKAKEIKSRKGYKVKIGKIKTNKGKRDVEISTFINTSLKNKKVIVLKDITLKKEISFMKKTIHENSLKEKVRKDFLSNISHDLKTPINVIYSSCQLQDMLLQNENYEALERHNLICTENCISLTKLTNNVIDISKISSENMSTNLKIGNIVEFAEGKVMSLVEFAKSKGIEIIFDTLCEELYINFDDSLMERVLINILSNSMKFTPEGGRILIKIREENENVKMDILDTGVGMSEEFVKRAFDRYSISNKSKGKEKGSGIGLFVVYNLVKIQGGDIELNSRVGEGTLFTLTFKKERTNEA